MFKLQFHHIGIATENITKTANIYSKLGFKVTDVIYDHIQNVNISFLEKDEHPLIELVEPVNERSPINNILNKSGTSIYHTCYEMNDMKETISFFKNKGFVLISKPMPAIAFNNRNIAFLYQSHVGLIELLEQK